MQNLTPKGDHLGVGQDFCDLYSPRNDPDPEMIPTFLLVDPEMIPKEYQNGGETWDCGFLSNQGK